MPVLKGIAISPLLHDDTERHSQVQSTVVETRQHIPYQVNSRHSLFPHSMSRASPYAVGPYQAGANQYGHVTSGFDSYGQPPSQAFNRPQYPFTSEDEAQTYYNIQAASSPAFMLPSSMNYYNAPAAQKAWSFSQGTRTPQSSLYSDTSSTNAISSSGPSFISNPSANDVSGTFPSVSSVISASTPTRDRTLPDPASTRNINGTISAAAESSADHVSLNSATYRPSGIWGSTDCFSADNRYRDISHSDSVSDTQDLNFGFSVPVSSSSGRIAQSSDQGHNIGSPSAFRANLSAGSELSPDSSAADNYSYGTESSPRRGSIGHLSNGDTYTRIPPNERLVNSYGVIHRPENQEFSGSRTGIASMSTEGSY